MSVPNLSRLERIDLREAWRSEPADFTPWLAQEENLALLGTTLGIALEPEATEKSVGPFSADILCRVPGEDHWVLIENQLETTDHTHLGQIITYAAGLDALTVIWVAAGFVDEHRAALDWLNENTAEGLNFFGVEVELWRIGDSPLAPRFNVVSKPNAWTKRVRAETAPSRKWDEESFFAELERQNRDGVRPARAILDWADQRMTGIWWGEGTRAGSFVPSLAVGGLKHYVVAVWTYGRAEIYFQWMRTRPPFDAEAKRQELLAKLNALAGVSLALDAIDRRPSIPLATLASEQATASFLAVLDWFVDEVRAHYGQE